MKILYININGVEIQDSENVCVVGKPEDAIVNKFYYELGKEILKGVDVSVTRDINKKGIITAFMARNKEYYDAIWKEWEKVKDKLLGENPTGPHNVTLPSEFVGWLNNNGQASYSEIAISLHSKDGVVEISIDKIYRNAIGIIVNSIELNKCKDCEQFVVNDRSVTDGSKISLDIMEKVKWIVFVSYDDIVCSQCGRFPCECKQNPVCPKCGKSPCECITDPPICSKCGKNPCECEIDVDWCKMFPVDKVTLGVTNIFDIQPDELFGSQVYCGNNGYWLIKHRKEQGNIGYHQNYNNNFVCSIYYENILPNKWEKIFGFNCGVYDAEVIRCLGSKGQVIEIGINESVNEQYITFLSSDNQYLLEFRFDRSTQLLNFVAASYYACPHCGSNDIKTDGLSFTCNKCKNTWGRAKKCPSCDSENIECSMQHFYCNDCGYEVSL